MDERNAAEMEISLERGGGNKRRTKRKDTDICAPRQMYDIVTQQQLRWCWVSSLSAMEAGHYTG